jgi:hypothetical protein
MLSAAEFPGMIYLDYPGISLQIIPDISFDYIRD